MDLTLLDSILECSVCLERLRQDARVLPCQHTFCLDCLKRVANKNPTSPLACPECRQQTNTYDIDSFPKNVFLIRLLDQIKPSLNGGTEGFEEKSTPKNETATTTKATTTNESDNKKQSSPQNKPSTDSSPQPSHIPCAKALYDFQMNPMEDEGCLKFQKGMIIQVTRRVDQNWAEGKLSESVGIFPLSFVHLNQAATALMQSYATKWRLPASMPAPNPTNDQTPSTSTSPQRHFPQQPPLQPTPVHPALILPTSPPTNSQVKTPPLASIPTSGQVPKDKAGIYIALHNYTPLKADELELKKGSQYIVKEACQDGWLKGCCSENLFKRGVFPGNYVMPYAYHQKMMAMQRTAALQAHKNQTNSNTQQMRSTGAYTNLGLSSIPPELPQRNLVAPTRTPSAIQSKPEASCENSPPAQTQKTDESANKMKKETVTEMLMKKLGYTRKSTDSSAYSMDNPVFEDISSTSQKPNPTQYNHMRSGSCPIDLGLTNTNLENLKFGSQRVKTRERSVLPMMNSDEKQMPISQKRHSINLSGPPSTSKSIQNTQLKAHHRKSSSLDTTHDAAAAAAVPEKYRCVTKYPANSRFELSLNVGDIVILQKKRDNGWYKGELARTGQIGLFPANFVELIELPHK